MTYNKPEVVVLTSAVSAVKASEKISHFYPDTQDGPRVLLTVNAYESDE